MTWLASAAKQLYGLFVDDGALSLAICLWLLATALVLPHVLTNENGRAIVLFAGLALLLLYSVRRAAGPMRPVREK